MLSYERKSLSVFSVKEPLRLSLIQKIENNIKKKFSIYQKREDCFYTTIVKDIDLRKIFLNYIPEREKLFEDFSGGRIRVIVNRLEIYVSYDGKDSNITYYGVWKMYIKSGVQEESEILKALNKFFTSKNVDFEIKLQDSAYQYGKYSTMEIVSGMPDEDVFTYICYVLKLNRIRLPYSLLAGIDKNLILTYARNNLNVYATKNYSKTFLVQKIESLLRKKFEVSGKYEYYHYQSIVHCDNIIDVLNCLKPLNGDSGLPTNKVSISTNIMLRLKNLNALIYVEDDKTYLKYYGV